MNRARYQARIGVRAKPTYPRALWIWRSWLGVMVAGCGIAPALAQAPEAASIPTNPTLPNRSVQRLARPTLRLESQGESVSELQAMLTLLGYYTGPVDGVYQEPTQAAVAQFQQAAGLVADGVVGPATWSLLLPITPTQASPPMTPTAAPLGTTELADAPISSPAPEELPDLGSATPEAAAESPASNPPVASQSTNSTPEEEAEQPSPIALPTLRRGMHGAAIVQLQERLQVLGIYNGSVDGVFGPETESAVMQAQRDNNLSPDGVVGPDTWRVLLR